MKHLYFEYILYIAHIDPRVTKQFNETIVYKLYNKCNELYDQLQFRKHNSFSQYISLHGLLSIFRECVNKQFFS